MKFKSSVALICTLSIMTTACINIDNVIGTGPKKSKSNRVTQQKNVNTIIGDDEVELQIISENSFQEAQGNESVLSVTNPKAKETLMRVSRSLKHSKIKNQNKNTPSNEKNLLVGFPLSLLDQQNIFGGVVTKVSDKTNVNIGMLKLSDITPIHVRPSILKTEVGTYIFALTGCPGQCEETSEEVVLVTIPVVGINYQSNMAILDISALGKELDIMVFQDPDGSYFNLKTISTEATNVEYDMKTLVFDVVTKLIPLPPKEEKKEEDAKEAKSEVAASERRSEFQVVKEKIELEPSITEVTTRWYLKLNSSSSPSFVPRKNTEGVGYFTTYRSKESKISRFSLNRPVHYYIKNVPETFKASFAKAFDNWNDEFEKLVKRKIFTYEFLDKDNERYSLIQAGDIRYNVVQWDDENLAVYDGFGPSIANQFSGETISSVVMIQGDMVVNRTSQWYQISGKATELTNQGRVAEANALMKKFNQQMSRKAQKLSQTTYAMKLNDKLHMDIKSQRKDHHDITKGTFEIVPEGVLLQEYLNSYFTHVVGHELGHNLGLRHNFKGSLGSHEIDEEHDTKIVSRSIMEYTGPSESHLQTNIGEYDLMAIAYGYLGEEPTNKNWFCTDQDEISDLASVSEKSPECSQSDATSDPFSYWESRLDRSLDLLLERKSAAAPVWSIKELGGRVQEAAIQLSAFALSAEKTAHTWTSFFGKEGRPTSATEIKDYLLKRINGKICDPVNFDILRSKESKEAQDAALKNLNGFLQVVAGATIQLKLFTKEDFGCK